jgi:hypothetical protein
MSLPSIVTFYQDGKEVKREFINCGWICNKRTIISGIKRALMMADPFEWDMAEAYGEEIKKEEICTQ